MSTLSLTIFAGVLISMFTALFTYFITSVNNKGSFRKVVKEEIKTHVGMHHKTDYSLVIEQTNLKLEKDLKDGIHENKDSISEAHKRIDEANKEINETAVNIAAIMVSQDFIVKALEEIKKRLSNVNS